MTIFRIKYQRSKLFSGLRSYQRRRYLICLILGLICGFTLSPNLINLSRNKSSPSLKHINLYRKDTAFHSHNKEDRTIADKLSKEVRILCWIMTFPENHMTRALPVKQIWGKRCNKILLMSSVEDKIVGTVALPVSEGRDQLWAKTKEAFKYIYKYHINDFDWFLKADDDTYVIVENLRAMLYAYSPDYPIYFGSKFKPYVKQGYMSGGAGYVLSKEAVKRFIEKALPFPEICRKEIVPEEDIELGVCLENVGVLAGDSRDEFSRGRFFGFCARDHLLANPTVDYWYWNYIYYKTDEGLDCCSDHAISFHYMEPSEMYTFDYIIYHLRPFGIQFKLDVLPQRKLLDDIIQDLNNKSINASNVK